MQLKDEELIKNLEYCEEEGDPIPRLKRSTYLRTAYIVEHNKERNSLSLKQ